MGDSVHPFAAGLELLPSGLPVNLTSVDFIMFGNRRWYFDTPFAKTPSGLAPQLEVSVDGVTWYKPISLVSSTASSVTYKYPLAGWSGIKCRILTRPTNFNWFPQALTVPVSMDATLPWGFP